MSIKSAHTTRRRGLTRFAFVLSMISLSSIAAMAAFGPQALSLRGLVAPLVGSAAAKAPAAISYMAEAEAAPLPAPLATSGTLASARSGHTATLLADGRVLVVGGSGDTTAEIFDPATSSSAPTGNTNHPRAGHTATRLADGRVLIAGGSGDATSEIYDPATGTFSLGPDMAAARTGHTATALGSGSVLIAGGGSDTAEVFDPATNEFSAAGTMTASRTNASAVRMADGRVFIAGGDGLSSAEIYAPGSGFAAAGNAMTMSRAKALLRVLPDGKVQIIGGNTDGSMEVYDPSIDTIGAYSHVVPAGDPCANLINHVLRAETRSALIYSGAGSADRDRANFTVTELGSGQALVIGGTSSTGNALDTVTVFQSSGATVTTDKLDYAPGETAAISGTGFAPGETVRVMIHEDPHTPQERGFDATADASGNFAGTYLVQDYDLNMKFVLGARGLTSGRTAQTTFTDSTTINNNAVSVGSQSPSSINGGGSATFSVGITFNGSGSCVVQLTFSGGPAGSTGVFSPATLTGTSSGTLNSILTVNTSGTTPSGSFTVSAVGQAGSDCAGTTRTATANLVINSNTATTTSVSGSSATYGDTSVTLNANVSPASVNSGSVTFTVKQGMATIGVATTDTTVVSGAASVVYSLPVGTKAGNYSVDATYNPGTGFLTSSGSGSLTIQKRGIEVSADSGQFKTYGDTDPATYTYAVTTGSLVSPDAFTGALTRTSGSNAGLYPINIGTLAISDGNGGNNYNLTFVSKDFEIKKRAASWATDPASKTYGDADPSPLTTGSGTNFVASDNVTATYSRVAGETTGLTTYHITATLSATPAATLDNYTITNNGAEFTINKRVASWTTDANSKTYGDADPTPLTTGSGSNFVAADNVSATYSRLAGESAGATTYHITATLNATPAAALDNYIITNAGAEFTINKRLATWTTNPNSKTYGDADPNPITTGSGSNFVLADNVTATYSRVPGESASASTYHITATLDATPGVLDNYTVTNAGAEFTINKRLATWTTSAASKTYGDTDPAGLTTGSGTNFVGTDNVTATYTRDAGESASPPTYHITAALSATPLSALDNYIITNNGAEFTINKRNATWTTNPNSKTYGDDDPSPLTTGSGSNFVSADNVTATYSRTPGEDLTGNPYQITATLSAATAGALDNYLITNNGANFTIAAATIKVDAVTNSKEYGEDDPEFDYTLSGFKLTDDEGDVTGSATCTRAPIGENVAGVYSITCEPGNLASPNYVFEAGEVAVFTINPAVLRVNAVANSKTYGDADPVFGFTLGGFKLDENATTASVTGDPVCDRTPGETAGLPYTITCAPGNLAAANYVFTPGDTAQFVINKRLATWTTNPNSKTYGDPDPAPVTTGSGSNFVAADNISATYSRIAGEQASPPTYHITATLADPNGKLGNYIVTNDGAEFTINKRLATWTTNPNSKTYGDADPSPLTTGSGSNFVAADNVTSTYTRSAGENASSTTYHITATLSATPASALDNYIITNSGAEFTINKRLTTWITNPAGKTYGNADSVPLTTGSGSNFVSADGVTATYSRSAGENFGTYHITATLASTVSGALDNYTITNNGADFTISKRPIQVTATAGQVKVYGNVEPAFAYSVTSGMLAGTDSFTGGLSRAGGENVGSYAISQGTLNINDGNNGGNYDLSFVSNVFQISARLITVKADAKTKVFGNPDPALTYQVTSGSLAFNDGFTGALSRDAGELVGTYAITKNTLAIGDGNGGLNYTLTYVGDNLTITTACSAFNGFLSPIGGANGTLFSLVGPGGSSLDTIRTFKLGSNIPFKFTATCFGAPLTSGNHSLRAQKYSNGIADGEEVIAVPTDAATTGNLFRYTDGQWHFNLSTKGLSQGTWMFEVTLFDGSKYQVWLGLKK